MKFLTENYGYLTEEELVQCSGYQFDSIFKKIDIYNRNLRMGKVVESAHQSGNILFTKAERETVKDMLHMIQKNLIEAYAKENNIDLSPLNENIFDRASEIKNKVINKASELKDKAVESMTGAWKDAYDFITKLLLKGISTVKDFLKFFISFFEKLGENANDCIRRSLKRLNIFNDDEPLENSDKDDSLSDANESYVNNFVYGLFEAEEEGKKISIDDEKLPDISKIDIDDNFNDIASGKKERTFLECVTEYVEDKIKAKETPKESLELDESYIYNYDGTLNEANAILVVMDKLKKNKLYQSIAGGKVGHWIKVIGSLWGSFLIGAVGSTLCYTVIPLFLDVLGLAFPGVGTIVCAILKWVVKITYLGWQVVKIIINRKKLIAGTNDKFISFGFCIQLIMTLGFFIAAQTGSVTKVFGHLGQSPFGAKVAEILMWPVKGVLKITGVEFITTHLSTICGKLINDMAIKFAEKGVGDFAGMTAQAFAEKMSELFANYNLNWSDVTHGNTGNIQPAQPTVKVEPISDPKEINKGLVALADKYLDQIHHDGTNGEALKNIHWKGNGPDGTHYEMHIAQAGERVDAWAADPCGVDGGKWLHFGEFNQDLHQAGMLVNMDGTHGIKFFTSVTGSEVTNSGDAVRNLLGQAVADGNLSAANTFLPIQINLVSVVPAPPANIVTPTINIVPMTFAPKLRKKVAGDILVILGTNTADWGPFAKEAMLYSKIEEKPMKDVIAEITDDKGKANVEGIGKYLQGLIDQVHKANEKADVNESYRAILEAEEEKKKHGIQDHKCAVLYVKRDDKDVPAVLFDYETMLAVDLMQQPGRKYIRQNPYYFAGILGTLFMRPCDDLRQMEPKFLPKWFHFRDHSLDLELTRQNIIMLLASIIARGVKENYELIGKNFVTYDEKEKKYVKNPNVQTAGPISQLGNCTLDQYVAALNSNVGNEFNGENLKPFIDILSADNKRDVKMVIKGQLPAFDENGLSQGSKETLNVHIETKEQAEDYIKNKLYPNLNNHDGSFYKDLTSGKYDQVAEWLLDDDGNVKLDVLMDKKVSKYLLRTEQSLTLDSTRTFKETLRHIFTKDDAEKNEKVENQNIKSLVQLIWDHYKDFVFPKTKKKKVEKGKGKEQGKVQDKDKGNENAPEEKSSDQDNSNGAIADTSNKDNNENAPEETNKEPESTKEETNKEPENTKDNPVSNKKQYKEVKSEEKPTVKDGKPVSKEEKKAASKKSVERAMKWWNTKFAAVIVKREDGKDKQVYKAFQKEPAIADYYGLKTNEDAKKIVNDKQLGCIIYNLLINKSEKTKDSYWDKLPKRLAKVDGKKAKSEELYKKQAAAYKAIYEWLYAVYSRKKENKSSVRSQDWNTYQTESVQFNLHESLDFTL